MSDYLVVTSVPIFLVQTHACPGESHAQLVIHFIRFHEEEPWEETHLVMLVMYLHHIGVVSVRGRSGSLGSLHVRLIALLVPYAGITSEMVAGKKVSRTYPEITAYVAQMAAIEKPTHITTLAVGVRFNNAALLWENDGLPANHSIGKSSQSLAVCWCLRGPTSKCQ